MAIYSIGEALIDFMPEGKMFFSAIGGAPANVAACVAKLNGKSYFVGRVGDDYFGSKIMAELYDIGVDTTFMGQTSLANTGLVFVTLGDSGERGFSFFRNPSADMFLSTDDVGNIAFTSQDILHFCSVDLIDMPVKYATMLAIDNCKAAGGTISFDPNVRKCLWKRYGDYQKVIREFIPKADIVKLAWDECEFIFGTTDIDYVAAKLIETAHRAIITLGDKGSKLYTKDNVIVQQPYPVHCVDTTGAGDTFIGTFLRYFRQDGDTAAMQKASAAAAIVCSQKGVVCSLPTEDALDSFILDNASK